MKIDRPVKSGGTRQYQTEVAAGFLDILDFEVDADLDALYQLVNGNLDNTNFASSGQRISYDKLDLTGRLVNTDISASAAIDPNKIAWTTRPNSIPGNVIQDNSLIVNAKAFPGTGVQDLKYVSVPGYTFVGGDIGVEKLGAELTWTSRNSKWLVVGHLQGAVGVSSAAFGSLSVRIRRDSTPGFVNGTLVAEEGTSGLLATGGAIVNYPVALTTLNIGVGPSAGVHRMGISYVLGSSNGVIVAQNQIATGWMAIFEFA